MESVGVPGEWGWFSAGKPRLLRRASRAARASRLMLMRLLDPLLAPADYATGGELLGYMLDGGDLGEARPGSRAAAAIVDAAGGQKNDYLFETRSGGGCVQFLDGRTCRAGGPKRANDCKGLGVAANAVFYDNGDAAVEPAAHPAPTPSEI